MSGCTVPELLCPAGDFEKLRFAIQYGANAVYLGGAGFSLRASQGGFQGEELAEAVAYCHSRGVRAYLALNALLSNDQADRIEGVLVSAAGSGVDAVIVSDMGALAAARRLIPQVDVHISTQAGVANWRAAAALYEWGAKRVILAREVSIGEIAAIREKAPPGLELEAFVHGAMCVSISGRCLLSSALTGRSANLGGCAQPCRWKWRLTEESRPGEEYPIRQEAAGAYILNAKDLCMIEHLDKLAAAGVTSVKIEGRAKSAYYAAVTANAYRAALDVLATGAEPYRPPAWAVEETGRVSHRPYGSGFYFGRPQNGQETESGGYLRAWDVVAVAVAWADGWLHLRQRNKFSVGDTLELTGPGRPPETLRVARLCGAAGEPLGDAPHAGMAVRIPCAIPAGPGYFLRKRRDA